MAAHPTRLHVVVGPTGVGKTDIAQNMATRLNSPILVADRIQCFEDLTVTSARTPRSREAGVPRWYPVRRWVRDGDLPAEEAAAGLRAAWNQLNYSHRELVLEGGSISLMRALFDVDQPPVAVSVDIRRVDDWSAHRRKLLVRAREMLDPAEPGTGLLEELVAAWRSERHRSFIASVNGPEAVLAWCDAHGCAPDELLYRLRPVADDSLIRLSSSRRARLLDELAQAIADAHLEHAREQQDAFAELFGAPSPTVLPLPSTEHVTASDTRRPPVPRGDARGGPRVTVFAGARAGASPAYQDCAGDLGRQLATAGFSIVYGGASLGCMGALADGALATGGHVVGVIPQGMIDREIGHSGVTELRIVTTMHERKAEMAELADAFVALPGGIGTAEEILEILTWRQLGLHGKPILLLDVDNFWAPLMACLTHWVSSGFLALEDLDHVQLVTTPNELVAELLAHDLARTGRTAEEALVASGHAE